VPKLRCPRNGTADETCDCSRDSALAHMPLDARVSGKVARVASASPDTGQQAASARAPRHVARARGEAGEGVRSVPPSMKSKVTGARPVWVAAAFAFVRLAHAQ